MASVIPPGTPPAAPRTPLGPSRVRRAPTPAARRVVRAQTAAARARAARRAAPVASRRNVAAAAALPGVVPPPGLARRLQAPAATRRVGRGPPQATGPVQGFRSIKGKGKIARNLLNTAKPTQLDEDIARRRLIPRGLAPVETATARFASRCAVSTRGGRVRCAKRLGGKAILDIINAQFKGRGRRMITAGQARDIAGLPARTSQFPDPTSPGNTVTSDARINRNEALSLLDTLRNSGFPHISLPVGTC